MTKSEQFTLYVDESGDAGITKIRTKHEGGASPYMTMGGVLIPDSYANDLKSNLDQFREQITKSPSLHCNNLGHEQKVRFADFLCQQRVLCFGVISLKETLGEYKEAIDGKSDLYYNKCAQYLLERLGAFLAEKKITKENVKIIFEEGNFDYNKMKGLIATCQRTPRHPNTEYLRNIDINHISQKEKNDESLLQMADLVAHSLYRSVYGAEYNVIESRYLKMIKQKFFMRSTKVIGNGIYAVHSIEDLSLPKDGKEFFNGF